MRLPRSTGILALSVAMACGGGGGGGGDATPTGPNPPPNPAGPSASAAVTMRGSDDGYGSQIFRFEPPSVTITRGGTVTWSNPTSETHNVTFGGSGAPADIGDHSSGSTSRTFANAGTFGYQCTNHAGMTGTVTVQ